MTFEEALREAKLRWKNVKIVKEFFNTSLIENTIIWLEKVIEALEKQIPKKPIYIEKLCFTCPACKKEFVELNEMAGFKYCSCGHLFELEKEVLRKPRCVKNLHFLCPSCNEELLADGKTSLKYCPTCGQKIDWSGKE